MPICKIIAEVGSTWKRETPALSKQAALASISTAARCGADAVKFQMFTADGLYSRERAPKQWEAVKPYELPPEWIPDLRIAVDGAGVELWFSVFDRDQIRGLAWQADAIKVASGELGMDGVFDEAIALSERLFVPFVFSVGTHIEAEVAQAVDRVKFAAIPDLILMTCVSKYPASPEDYSFAWMHKYLVQGIKLGLSDHTLGMQLIPQAILGYCTYFEKHFRLDDTPNPDYNHSLIPEKFTDYVQRIREGEMCFYNFKKTLAPEEETERRWMQRGKDGKRPVF